MKRIKGDKYKILLAINIVLLILWVIDFIVLVCVNCMRFCR